MSGVSLWAILNIIVVATIAGLSIYALILLIKALKIYIDKNS